MADINKANANAQEIYSYIRTTCWLVVILFVVIVSIVKIQNADIDWKKKFSCSSKTMEDKTKIFFLNLEPNISKSVETPVGYKMCIKIISGKGEKILCTPNKNKEKAFKLIGDIKLLNEPVSTKEFLSEEPAILRIAISPI